MKRTSIPLALLFWSVVAAATPPTPVTLVICAPGYPGSTEEAQPSMDALADAVSKSVGWPVGTVKAEYQETEAGGLARYASSAPTLALVPLPFYLAHRRELSFTARLEVVPKDGKSTEVWTLVAKKGRVTSPASLAEWKLVSLAAYAPDFVRRVALAPWGNLPDSVTFVASGQALSALRKAAAGENVAVLMDSSQTAALPSLPFAEELETITSSQPVPAIVLCTVGAALGPIDTKRLTSGLLKLRETPEGAAALDAVRLAQFVPLDDKALASVRKAYAPTALVSTK